jgi:hypothetical protein
MGISVIPAPSAASKTAFRTTLTSGTSYTVPAGVTYLNVTLYGGGGGGGSFGNGDSSTAAGVGGTTTFTGADSASGGVAGISAALNQNSSINNAGSSSNQPSNTGYGGGGAFSSVSLGATSQNTLPVGINLTPGGNGKIISSTLAVSPGASIAYAIGAGGTAGSSTASNGGGAGTGGVGGSGKIEIEYWV